MRKVMLAILVLALALAGCNSAGKPGQVYQPAKQEPAKQEPAKQEPAKQEPAKQEPAKQEGQAEKESGKRKTYSAPPAMGIDPAKQYIATMETSLGTLKIELFAQDAPQTVNNFVFLAREGFYDGLKFHRIIKDFMIQGGDPLGTGGGGPGYKFKDELPPKRKYTRGMLAMANAGPNTQGSQFFICTGESCGGLDGYPNYTQFGMVTEGLDILSKLESVEVVVAPGSRDPVPSMPKNPPTIVKISIEEK